MTPHFLKEAAIPNLLSFFDRKSSDVDTAKLRNFVQEKKWGEFVQDVLIRHYDPLYQHAISKRTGSIIKWLEIDRPVEHSLDFVCSRTESASCSIILAVLSKQQFFTLKFILGAANELGIGLC